jgi:hypothetical protein
MIDRKSSARNEHEIGLARFVLPAKRARYEQLLSNPKRRVEVIRELAHFGPLDGRYVFEVPADWTAEDILKCLLERGAPKECHVMSELPDLDGRLRPLEMVIREAFGSGYGTFLSSIPGALGFLETEDPGARFLLHRTT